MNPIAKLFNWLAPPRTGELHRVLTGAAEAERRLAEVQSRTPKVQEVVYAHRRDRTLNHYGERIKRALEGGEV